MAMQKYTTYIELKYEKFTQFWVVYIWDFSICMYYAQMVILERVLFEILPW